jgi:anti-sigma regulatory factor (Ser/Thr protein kinase)
MSPATERGRNVTFRLPCPAGTQDFVNTAPRPHTVSAFADGFGQLTELSISHALSSGHRLELSPDPHSPRAARAFVREHVPDIIDLRDTAELLVSELVTNGVLHAGTPMTLDLVARDSSVLLGVTDKRRSVPADQRPRPPSLVAENGRGIALVASIARSWGVTQRADGKIVWCLIETGDDGVP